SLALAALREGAPGPATATGCTEADFGGELEDVAVVRSPPLRPQPSPISAITPASATNRVRLRGIESRLARASGGACRYPGRMSEDATAVEIRPHVRLLHGMRRPENWVQLVQFGLVGGLGFVVNLAVYALFVHSLGVDYHLAAVAAWLVAVAN